MLDQLSASIVTQLKADIDIILNSSFLKSEIKTVNENIADLNRDVTYKIDQANKHISKVENDILSINKTLQEDINTTKLFVIDINSKTTVIQNDVENLSQKYNSPSDSVKINSNNICEINNNLKQVKENLNKSSNDQLIKQICQKEIQISLRSNTINVGPSNLSSHDVEQFRSDKVFN